MNAREGAKSRVGPVKHSFARSRDSTPNTEALDSIAAQRVTTESGLLLLLRKRRQMSPSPKELPVTAFLNTEYHNFFGATAITVLWETQDWAMGLTMWTTEKMLLCK